jgi:hypothetical protein
MRLLRVPLTTVIAFFQVAQLFISRQLQPVVLNAAARLVQKRMYDPINMTLHVLRIVTKQEVVHVEQTSYHRQKAFNLTVHFQNDKGDGECFPRSKPISHGYGYNMCELT